MLPSLNEGRSLDPGDTPNQAAAVFVDGARSTKAGAWTPATHGFKARLCGTVPRSTKAGAWTPATHLGQGLNHTPSVTLNEGRSLDPGDTFDTPGPSRRRWTLNEGRSLDPGDTSRQAHAAALSRVAQRRPEPGPRRHPRCLSGRLDELVAQRRPEPGPRRHTAPRVRPLLLRLRSTKAGAWTPATPGTHSRRPLPLPALNEGRSLDPGDTAKSFKGGRSGEDCPVYWASEPLTNADWEPRRSLIPPARC